MKILKSFKNFDLIEVAPDTFCVRKTTHSRIFGTQITYMDLYRNGTTLTHNELTHNITLGSLSRAEERFNANAIMAGAL